MGILNALFGSKSAAQKIVMDDEFILEQWKDYCKTVPQKKILIEKLAHDIRLKSDLKELKLLLTLELTNICGEEKTQAKLRSELESVEHSSKIRRVHRLEQCLGYAATKYEYVHGLLLHLHSLLKYQMHLVSKLQSGFKGSETIPILHLKSQLELELELHHKIQSIETFHDLFLALVKGEHIISTMDAKEKQLLAKMQKEFQGIFSGNTVKGITYEWVGTVFDSVQNIVMDHEAIMAKGFDPHVDVDFEFVNLPGFVDLVKKSAQGLRKREFSEQMINVFVNVFREWYNHERD